MDTLDLVRDAEVRPDGEHRTGDAEDRRILDGIVLGDHDHVVAALHELLGESQADAARRPGDDGERAVVDGAVHGCSSGRTTSRRYPGRHPGNGRRPTVLVMGGRVAPRDRGREVPP